MIQRGTSGVPVRVRVPSMERKGGGAVARGCNDVQRREVSAVGCFPHWRRPDGVSAQQHAAEFVRDVCGITSRAELDHNATAATLFHEAVRKPFVKWSGIYG